MSLKNPFSTAGPFGQSTGGKAANIGTRSFGSMASNALGGPLGSALFNYGWGRLFPQNFTGANSPNLFGAGTTPGMISQMFGGPGMAGLLSSMFPWDITNQQTPTTAQNPAAGPVDPTGLLTKVPGANWLNGAVRAPSTPVVPPVTNPAWTTGQFSPGSGLGSMFGSGDNWAGGNALGGGPPSGWSASSWGMGGGCFSGAVKIITTDGLVRMDELPNEVTVRNKTGDHKAKLLIHPYNGMVIALAADQFVTPDHPMQLKDGSWVPAEKKYPDAPRYKFSGTVYNLEVLSGREEDKHYILESGDVAHNKLAGYDPFWMFYQA